MLQVFNLDVAYVFTHMLQVFHSDVSYVFTHTLQVFHLDVAYVLQWLHTCFPGVSDVYMLKVFQLFQIYVASVSSRCYKSRSGVAHVAVGPIYSSRLL